MSKDNLKKWPMVEGRYQIGNKTSPVAVCTNASIDSIKINLEKVALIGKCVTENIGIEKIIQNIVSNSNIRYLVLCGKESKGHFVSQAIVSLLKNGLDEKRKIIGAKGNMPYLRGIDDKLIERFKKQIKTVDITGEIAESNVEEVIDKLLKTKPEEFSMDAISIKRIEEINAHSAEIMRDPNGYFVISIDKQRKKIILEYYKNGKIDKKIIGNNAKEICDTIIKLNLVGDFEQKLGHLTYLGREAQKAEIALRNNFDYEQDSDLIITKVGKEKTEPADEYGWFD